MFGFTRWKVTAICAVAALGLMIASLNLFDDSTLEKFPSWAPSEKINLGLDLQGGSHLLLEVDFDAVMKEQMGNLLDTIRAEFRKAKISTTRLAVEDMYVIADLEDPSRGRDVQALIAKVDRAVEVSVGADGGVKFGYSPAYMNLRKRTVMEQSLEIVRRRVDESGTKEPSIQLQGESNILVQLPGLKDPSRIKELLGKTAKMTFQMVDENTSPSDAAAGRIPPSSKLVPYSERRGGSVVVQKRVLLGGDSLIDAKPDMNPERGWTVAFRFDSKGARKFADVTSKNIGKRFAILLDNQVITDPVIKGAITGGSGIIEGGFTSQTATDLAVLMRAGALPAPLKVVEERTVGADLGADSIEAGKMASMIGLLLVVVFMVSYYGFFGVIADIGVIFNLILTIAVTTLIQATLTLPGIAGIVLALGMAVDANVLINERIDEELRGGKSIVGAIEAGYNRALTSIIDSNLTTLIAAAMLYYFGSGPVKGFAITLSIGLLISMFTAVTFTRMLIAGWWMKFHPKKFKVHVLRFIKPDTKFKFMSHRKLALGLAVVISVVSIGLLATKGLNLGIDFKGGIVLEARTKDAADLSTLRSKLGGLDLGDVALQEFGSPNDILIRAENNTTSDKELMQTVDSIKSTVMGVHEGTEFRRVDFVGPKVSDALFTDAMIAMLLSLLAIMGYVWIRFEWQFGVSALLALAHDCIATLGFIALTGLEFNLSMVAGILTLLGYSINDSVIIFDRIRENMVKYKENKMDGIIDQSLNDTLSRSIMTVVTVLLVLVALAIFGGPVLQGFSVMLIWGLIVGTYSSIFVSAMPLTLLGLTPHKKEKEEEEGFVPSED